MMKYFIFDIKSSLGKTFVSLIKKLRSFSGTITIITKCFATLCLANYIQRQFSRTLETEFSKLKYIN